jgi:Fe-S cluster biogenesis protein NfuA
MDDEVELKDQVKKILKDIRPALQKDGGDVEFVDVTDEGIVKIRLKGACKGCPMSEITLKMGIEKILKDKIDKVNSVEAV